MLSWRFGVQCLPSICGRIVLSPCFLSSSCWTGHHGIKFIVTFLPRCLLDVAFRAFSLSAVGKLFHGNYVRWHVSAIQPTSFQCTISSHAPLQLMNPSILPAHAFSCAGPFAVFCIRVCIIILWYITLLLLFHMEWKDMAWREMAYAFRSWYLSSFVGAFFFLAQMSDTKRRKIKQQKWLTFEAAYLITRDIYIPQRQWKLGG